MMGCFGKKEENPMFSGHAFQDFAAQRPESEKCGIDLVSCFAPLIDAMMVNHRLESECHAQRMTELREVSK